MRMTRMMCGKALRDGISNGLLRGTGLEDTSGRDETEIAWVPCLKEWMKQT